MTKKPWRALLIAIFVIAIVEVCLSVAVFVNLTYRQGVPKDSAAQRLLLMKWLVLPFLPANPRISPYTGGHQRYLGYLTRDNPEWIELLRPDALLGSRPGRNITAFANMGLGDERASMIVTNDEGFSSAGARDFHYGLTRPAGRCRTIILGGSTVFGWGAESPQWNLPARLNAALKRQDGGRHEVINAGVLGYDSAQEFLYFTSELVHYQPDLIIVYDGWNDEYAAEVGPSGPKVRTDGVNYFKNSEHLLMEKRFTASYSLLGSARLLLENVAARALAGIRQTGLFWMLRSPYRQIVQRLAPASPKPQLKYDSARLGIYERNLTSILSFADQNGIRIALFLQPIMWIDGRTPTQDEARLAETDSDSIPVRQAFYAEARPMFDRLRQRYQRAGLVCIEDLSQVLRDTPDQVYINSGHLLGRGNQVVADEMVKRLAACGVLGQ